MKNIKQIIREIITVIIGILIALFINNWNDERKEKKYLDQVYASIQKELEESVDGLKTTIPKQLAAADTIQKYITDSNMSLYNIMIRSDGIHLPNIRTTSWDAISNSRIDLIEYEKLAALREIADRKENLNKRIEKQLDYLFENFEDTSQSKKEIMHMMTLDIVGAEKRFQNALEELIKTGTISTTE